MLSLFGKKQANCQYITSAFNSKKWDELDDELADELGDELDDDELDDELDDESNLFPNRFQQLQLRAYCLQQEELRQTNWGFSTFQLSPLKLIVDGINARHPNTKGKCKSSNVSEFVQTLNSS